MSRGFVSIGPGGPHVGVIIGRRDVWAIIKLLVALAILGWALNFTSWAYDNPGDVAFSVALGGAFAAVIWIACKIAGKPFRLHDD
jgi:membrane associated rhomboid family serine protease